MTYVQETRLGDLIVDQWAGTSETAALLVAGSLPLLLLLLGVIAWLRGRKLSAGLIWLVLASASAWFLTPIPWLEGRFDIDELSVSLGLGVAVGIALIMGVLSAARLAKPSSWWAQRRYASEKYGKAVERYGWSRIKAR